MSIKTFEDKDLKDKVIKETSVEEQEYFFPDIDGQQITVKAKSAEEAVKKAREAIKDIN